MKTLTRKRKIESLRQRHLQIDNPNQWGQGRCRYYKENPHHSLLTKYGWTYSHTTRVNRASFIYAIHTYRYKDTDWVIGVKATPRWEAEAHRLNTGVVTPLDYYGIRKYLRYKTCQLRKETE